MSVENVDLHETVQRQAVTDELTGLFNHRRFQEVITQEVERARRYGQEMGLIMLDIDNFKRVNDTYGHLQGDMVLREVARVLRQSSREIDEPARYGGEEMAVALPQTDLEGAYRFAERVRRRIEALDLPLLDGDGTLKVTASFGAASLGTSTGTARTRWSPRRTQPCTAPSGPGRTVRSGPSNLSRRGMGLLDDAIREHLELKRRHGADPDEVSRQEREALGAPVSRRVREARREAGDDARGPQEAPSREPEPVAEVADVPEIEEPPEMPGEREPGAGGGRAPARRRTRGWSRTRRPEPEPEPEPEPSAAPEPAARGARAGAAPRARTCSRRRPSSSRRRRSTTACGSSRSLRAASTGTSSPLDF